MTATIPAPLQAQITAEQFARDYGGRYVELLDGVVQELPMPHQRHGHVSFRAAFLLGQFIVGNDLGRITTNDSFVQTKPDRVRGADVCYFGYERLPRGPMPQGCSPCRRIWSSRSALPRRAGTNC
jgi:Uma2 family endonuclease